MKPMSSEFNSRKPNCLFKVHLMSLSSIRIFNKFTGRFSFVCITKYATACGMLLGGIYIYVEVRGSSLNI